MTDLEVWMVMDSDDLVDFRVDLRAEIWVIFFLHFSVEDLHHDEVLDARVISEKI